MQVMFGSSFPFSPPSSRSNRPFLQQLADIIPKFRHVESITKFLYILLDIRHIETRLRLENPTNVLNVFRTMSHCLHDDQVFRGRYWNTDRAKSLCLRPGCGLDLK